MPRTKNGTSPHKEQTGGNFVRWLVRRQSLKVVRVDLRTGISQAHQPSDGKIWVKRAMAENKTKQTAESVSVFLEGLADQTKRSDAKSLIKLMQGATGEKPKLWGPSIIGFGSHHYVYDSGREGDTPVVSFSPRKTAIVLYGVTGSVGALSLLKQLGKHSKGKGCLYIKKLADVDQNVLSKLIAMSVSAKRAN